MTTLAARVLEAIEAAERSAHEAGPAVIAWATYRHADGGMGYTSPVAQNGDVWVVAGKETHPSSVRKPPRPAWTVSQIPPSQGDVHAVRCPDQRTC